MHNFSGHSLQFIVNFIITPSVLLNMQGAWKKVALLFNRATRRSAVCMLFCAGISMSCLEAP